MVLLVVLLLLDDSMKEDLCLLVECIEELRRLNFVMDHHHQAIDAVAIEINLLLIDIDVMIDVVKILFMSSGNTLL